MNSQEKIGKMFKKARKEMGLKQSEIAEKAGVGANYYSIIERGEANPTVEILTKIAKVLRIKPSEISL